MDAFAKGQGQRGAHIVPFKRPNPVARDPVSEHRLLVETGTEEEDTIDCLRRELQLDDGTAVAGTHDGNLPHKINTRLWSGGRLDHVRVFWSHARGRDEYGGTQWVRGAGPVSPL